MKRRATTLKHLPAEPLPPFRRTVQRIAVSEDADIASALGPLARPLLDICCLA